jgi:hypothetical protein
MLASRVTQAELLHATGPRMEAKALFTDAERRQEENQPSHPLLYSTAGYFFCNLLLADRNWVAARDRATKTIVIACQNNWIHDVALDTLTLACAHFGLALESLGPPAGAIAKRADLCAVRTSLDEAIDGLRNSGMAEDVPRGLLVRAAFRRNIGNWGSAARDLDEVEEIAEPGPMRLFLCDMAFERARLALARCEAFAPLNGLVDDSPPKPDRSDEAERKSLHAEAAKRLAVADGYITTCGYHRRDEELAELQAVLRGECTFASLPLRI